MGNINISTAQIKAYANEQRTMNNERYSKQTQSNPCLKAKTNATFCTPCHSDRRHASSVSKWRNLLQYSRRLPNRLFGPTCREIMPCIMQNKANFLNAKTNATVFVAKDYEKKPPLPNSKKQTQSNPIPQRDTPPRPLAGQYGKTSPSYAVSGQDRGFE